MRFASLAVLLALLIGCGKKSADKPDDGPDGSRVPPHERDGGRTLAADKLKKIGVAMHNFESANGFLPAGVVAKGGTVGLSWRVQLLPHLDQQALYHEFKLDQPWDSEHNKKLLDKIPPVFATSSTPGETHFRTTAGQHGLIREAPTPKKGPPVNLHVYRTPGSSVPGLTIGTISDGSSNTLMVVTAEPVPWTKPDEVGVGREEYARSDSFIVPKLGGLFADGFHGVMADGKVLFFPNDLKPESLRALLTPQGGEVLLQDAGAIVQPPKPASAAPPGAAPDDAKKLAVANIQKVILAAHDFHDATGSFPGGVVGPRGELGLSWRVQLLPYLGHDTLYREFHLTEPWDSTHNHGLLAEMPAVFLSAGKKAGTGNTFLRTTQGTAGMILTPAANAKKAPPALGVQPGQPFRGRRVSDIQDGLSITALAVEAADAVPWTKPDELTLSSPYAEKALPKLGGPFDGGFHAGMADGHVIFFKGAITPRDVFRLLAPADGEAFEVEAHAAYKVAIPKR